MQSIKISENLINFGSTGLRFKNGPFGRLLRSRVTFLHVRMITWMSGGSNGVLSFYLTMIMLSFAFSRFDYQSSLLNKTMKEEHWLLVMFQCAIRITITHACNHSCMKKVACERSKWPKSPILRQCAVDLMVIKFSEILIHCTKESTLLPLQINLVFEVLIFFAQAV